MTRAPLPRYASLVDTASGDFSHTFKSRNPPVPLSIDEAPSLDAYVQSFKVEVHRDSWRPAQDAGAEGFEDPTVTHCGNANVIHNESLNQANIRVHARLYEEKLIAFGFTTRPSLTCHQVYLYVYLMISQKFRALPWKLQRRDDNVTLNWRDLAPVEFGDLEMILDGTLMNIEYDRSTVIFRSRTNAMSDASSSKNTTKSTTSSQKLRRTTPKEMVRERDSSKCCLSGYSNNVWNISGELKVAHIIPISLPYISDKLRYIMDPAAFKNASPSSWRKKAPNHPSNLFCLSSGLENAFDEFALTINPIAKHPQIAFNRTESKELISEEDFDYLNRRGLSFPAIPFTLNGCPGPSPTLLLVHLLSSLAQNSRLCMTDELCDDSLEIRRGVDAVGDWLQSLEF